MSEELVYVKIHPGRGSHTTSDGVLHRDSDENPVFPVLLETYKQLESKFIVCDPETGEEIVPEIKTTTKASAAARVKTAAKKAGGKGLPAKKTAKAQ